MVSTWFSIRCKSPLTDSHPHLTAMTDTNTLQQLQNYIVGMERCHEEELRKLKANHDQLETRVICPQGDEQSAQNFLERTQGESHPRCIGNTIDDLSLSHVHCPVGQIIRRHSFVDHIMEADNTLGVQTTQP